MNLSYLSENDLREYKIKAKEKRFFLKATVVKNNDGPPTGDLLLHREEVGYLVLSDRTADPEGADEAVLARVRKILLQDRLAEKTYSKSSFEDKFGGKDGPVKLGLGKTKLRKLLTTWIEDGKLFQDGKGRLTLDTSMASGWPRVSDKSDVKS